MPDRREITVTINGESFTREVETRLTLADFIRHECELTGTHLGCEHGVCGACTILLDGLSARSCLMLAVQAHGHEILVRKDLGTSGSAPDDGLAARTRRHELTRFRLRALHRARLPARRKGGLDFSRGRSRRAHA